MKANDLSALAAEIRAFPFCGSLDVAKSRLLEDISGVTSIPPISRKRSMAVNQAIALDTLKRGSRLRLPAFTVDVVPYFDFNKTHLRGDRGLDNLRR
jgi:hypothetical protein